MTSEPPINKADQGTSPTPTHGLQTVWLLSVLVFLISYTYEFFAFNQLYENQRFLLILLQLSIAFWALVEWILLKKAQTMLPLVGLGIALVAQLLIGVIRFVAGVVMEAAWSDMVASPGHLNLSLAMLFSPLYLLLFLLISKLLINIFSYAERQRSVMLEREVKIRLQAEAALKDANKELQRLATTDRLTGTWNRSYLEEIVNREMIRSERYDQPLSMALIDLDHFKAINDTFGHLAGDAVLIEFTRRIHTNIRSVDILARWGGEEFVLLLPECGLEECAVAAEKLRALLADKPFPEVGQVTASFGIAQFKPQETFSTCLNRADKSLYAAKSAGRNRVGGADTLQ